MDLKRPSMHCNKTPCVATACTALSYNERFCKRLPLRATSMVGQLCRIAAMQNVEHLVERTHAHMMASKGRAGAHVLFQATKPSLEMALEGHEQGRAADEPLSKADSGAFNAAHMHRMVASVVLLK